MEKKARSTTTEETEEVRIMLWDIDEEEKLKIAKKMRENDIARPKEKNKG